VPKMRQVVRVQWQAAGNSAKCTGNKRQAVPVYARQYTRQAKIQNAAPDNGRGMLSKEKPVQQRTNVNKKPVIPQTAMQRCSRIDSARERNAGVNREVSKVLNVHAASPGQIENRPASRPMSSNIHARSSSRAVQCAVLLSRLG